MVSSKLCMKVFLLEGITTIEEVESTVLKRSYKSKLFIAKKNIKMAEMLSEEEKTVYYKWDMESKILEEMLVSNIGGIATREKTLEIVADLEYSKRKKTDDNGRFFPREERVDSVSVKVMFFQIEESIYSIIFSSNEKYIDRTKKLIGEASIRSVDIRFELETDLFNWLFYKYKEADGVLGQNLTINNITGFIGNSIDEENVFKSLSDQTSDLTVTKAFISNGELLRNVTVRITTEEVEMIFSIDDVSNVDLFLNRSAVFFNELCKERLLPVYLYTILIPKLKSVYSANAQQFLETDKRNFSTKMGLEVIRSIMGNNNISVEEVANLFSSANVVKNVE